MKCEEGRTDVVSGNGSSKLERELELKHRERCWVTCNPTAESTLERTTRARRSFPGGSGD